jgi:hypothetical protein
MTDFEKSAVLLKAGCEDNSRITLCIAEATRRSHSDITIHCSMSLKQGTILQAKNTAEEEYYVCIQPLCDSVRLKGDANFMFIKAIKDDKRFNLVIGDHNEAHKLKVEPHPKKLVNLTFLACEQDKMVVGNRDGDNIIFETKCGHANKEFEFQAMRLVWIGELKEGLSQYYVTQAGASLSRVGIDINEWARLK